MTTRTTLLLLLEIYIFSQHLPAQNLSKELNPYFHSVEQTFLFQQSFETPVIAHYTEFSSCGIQLRNNYHLEELTEKQIHLFQKWDDNGFLLRVNHLGYSRFGTLDLRMGYSRIWNKKITIGLDFVYLFQHATAYNNRNCITFSLSLFGKVNSKTGVGIQLFNPVQLHFWGDLNSTIPIKLQFLGYYLLHKSMILTFSVTKYAPGFVDFRFTTLLHHQKLGVEYSLSLRSSSFGITYRFKRFQLHTHFQYHYQLGGSPGTSLNYLWN